MNYFSRFMPSALLAFSMIFFYSAPANAAVTYVGSWTVDQGPNWWDSPPNGPLAYTGQEAAALLFGGNAADYYISTVDSNVLNINHMAWYDVIGVGQNQFAENYFSKYLGQYYGPTNGYGYSLSNAASAYVHDNTNGLTNYAFKVAPVPEPETYAMLLAGLGLLSFTAKRKKQSA